MEREHRTIITFFKITWLLCRSSSSDRICSMCL